MWAFLGELGLWLMTHIVWDKLCDFIHLNVNIYVGFPRGTRPWLMTHIMWDKLCDFIHFNVKLYLGFPRCTRPCLMTQTLCAINFVISSTSVYHCWLVFNSQENLQSQFQSFKRTTSSHSRIFKFLLEPLVWSRFWALYKKS
jgi:hypothetical protein